MNWMPNTGAGCIYPGDVEISFIKNERQYRGMITGAIKIDELDVDQNTGAIVTLTGEAGKLTVDGDTGAMFKGIDLKTDNCSVTATTGAGVYITVQKELYVKANTGGFVKI